MGSIVPVGQRVDGVKEFQGGQVPPFAGIAVILPAPRHRAALSLFRTIPIHHLERQPAERDPPGCQLYGERTGTGGEFRFQSFHFQPECFPPDGIASAQQIEGAFAATGFQIRHGGDNRRLLPQHFAYTPECSWIARIRRIDEFSPVGGRGRQPGHTQGFRGMTFEARHVASSPLGSVVLIKTRGDQVGTNLHQHRCTGRGLLAVELL